MTQDDAAGSLGLPSTPASGSKALTLPAVTLVTLVVPPDLPYRYLRPAAATRARNTGLRISAPFRWNGLMTALM